MLRVAFARDWGLEVNTQVTAFQITGWDLGEDLAYVVGSEDEWDRALSTLAGVEGPLFVTLVARYSYLYSSLVQ